jgi:hypothetical protein
MAHSDKIIIDEASKIPQSVLDEVAKVMKSRLVAVTPEALMEIFKQRIEHIMKKNHDYGDAWQTNGPFTPLMRMKEKLIRVETLSDGRLALVTDEKVETNVAEVLDYSALWLLWKEQQDVSKFGGKFVNLRLHDSDAVGADITNDSDIRAQAQTEDDKKQLRFWD